MRNARRLSRTRFGNKYALAQTLQENPGRPVVRERHATRAAQTPLPTSGGRDCRPLLSLRAQVCHPAWIAGAEVRRRRQGYAGRSLPDETMHPCERTATQQRLLPRALLALERIFLSLLSLSPGFKRILLAEDHSYLVLVLAITALPKTRILGRLRHTPCVATRSTVCKLSNRNFRRKICRKGETTCRRLVGNGVL
jgi:hypothetical protein